MHPCLEFIRRLKERRIYAKLARICFGLTDPRIVLNSAFLLLTSHLACASTVIGNLQTITGQPGDTFFSTNYGLRFIPPVTPQVIGTNTVLAIPVTTKTSNGFFSIGPSLAGRYDVEIGPPHPHIPIVVPLGNGVFQFNDCANLAVNAQMFGLTNLSIVAFSGTITNGQTNVTLSLNTNSAGPWLALDTNGNVLNTNQEVTFQSGQVYIQNGYITYPSTFTMTGSSHSDANGVFTYAGMLPVNTDLDGNQIGYAIPYWTNPTGWSFLYDPRGNFFPDGANWCLVAVSDWPTFTLAWSYGSADPNPGEYNPLYGPSLPVDVGDATGPTSITFTMPALNGTAVTPLVVDGRNSGNPSLLVTNGGIAADVITTPVATVQSLYAPNGTIDNFTSTNIYMAGGYIENVVINDQVGPAYIYNMTVSNIAANVCEFSNVAMSDAVISNVTLINVSGGFNNIGLSNAPAVSASTANSQLSGNASSPTELFQAIGTNNASQFDLVGFGAQRIPASFPNNGAFTNGTIDIYGYAQTGTSNWDCGQFNIYCASNRVVVFRGRSADATGNGGGAFDFLTQIPNSGGNFVMMIHTGTNATIALGPQVNYSGIQAVLPKAPIDLTSNTLVEANLTIGSNAPRATGTFNAITNNGLVWYASATNTGGPPLFNAPVGSLCSSTNGNLYICTTNGVWHQLW